MAFDATDRRNKTYEKFMIVSETIVKVPSIAFHCKPLWSDLNERMIVRKGTD